MYDHKKQIEPMGKVFQTQNTKSSAFAILGPLSVYDIMF